ncbi:MAG TPA: hypothetical protein VHY08_10155 [Bacillota bacterium]|nr:hypothetical protein [Bacillota bacterium]
MNQQRPVIQRKEKTWGGEWEASQYNAKKEGSTIKASIKIEFTPGGSVDTKRIGFVQTVRVYNKGTPYFGIEATPNDKEEKETKEAHAIKATNAIVNKDTGVTDEGTRIDRRVNYRNPVYGTSNQLEEKDKSELDLANYSGLGGIQYGYKYIDGSQQKEQNAWMTDFPKLPGTQENSGQVFETAAIALAGKQTGMYYGSVQWGWKADDQGKPQPVPFKAIHESVPSATFLKAARIWNESKTLEKKQEGYDEQGKIKYKIKQDDKGQPMKDEKEEPIYEYDRRATLKLPVPDVKVITEPIKVGGVDFPAGTRIGIAANQIVVVDGRDFGKYSMVSPEDMEKIKDKIKDERP